MSSLSAEAEKARADVENYTAELGRLSQVCVGAHTVHRNWLRRVERRGMTPADVVHDRTEKLRLRELDDATAAAYEHVLAAARRYFAARGKPFDTSTLREQLSARDRVVLDLRSMRQDRANRRGNHRA